MKLVISLLSLGFVYNVATATELTANEKVVRKAIRELVTKSDVRASNEYLYKGVGSDGEVCFVNISTRVATKVDGRRKTSGINVHITSDSENNSAFVGFSGEGPQDIAGKPVVSLESKPQVVTLKSTDSDESSRYRSFWTLNLNFKNSDHALENLTSAESSTLRTGGATEERSAGACGELQFAVKLNGKINQQVMSDINKRLDNDLKVEIFNGCYIGKSINLLDCGFATDGENDDQGNAVFKINSDGSVTFVELQYNN